jgi:hypothetical protein
LEAGEREQDGRLEDLSLSDGKGGEREVDILTVDGSGPDWTLDGSDAAAQDQLAGWGRISGLTEDIHLAHLRIGKGGSNRHVDLLYEYL